MPKQAQPAPRRRAKAKREARAPQAGKGQAWHRKTVPAQAPAALRATARSLVLDRGARADELEAWALESTAALSGMKLPSVNLRRGSTGPAVKLLQAALVKLGNMTQQQMNTGPGVFGARTEAALKKFQRAHGVDAIGVYGPKTRAAFKQLGATLARVPAPSPGPARGEVSLAQLQAIMPHLTSARARQCLPHLNKAMKEANITTARRQAAFLAQLAHESAEFRYFEELASGAAYEGRRDLGNTHPGDGVRFKGRGPIQLTGRSNYRRAGKALGIDLETHPKRAADVDVGFRTAAWFWTGHKLNTYADRGDFHTITLRINGGTRGEASRNRYYRRALSVLS